MLSFFIYSIYTHKQRPTHPLNVLWFRIHISSFNSSPFLLSSSTHSSIQFVLVTCEYGCFSVLTFLFSMDTVNNASFRVVAGVWVCVWIKDEIYELYVYFEWKLYHHRHQDSLAGCSCQQTLNLFMYNGSEMMNRSFI